MKRVASVVAAVVVVVAAIGATGGACLTKRAPPHDLRFVTLGELAADLANDDKTFELIVDKLGADVGPLGAAQREVLLRLFRAHDWSGLDREPVTTLDALKDGLDMLAQHRAAHPPTPPTPPTTTPPTPPPPPPPTTTTPPTPPTTTTTTTATTATATATATTPATQPLGIPTGKPGPVGEPFLSDIGLEMKHGDRVDAEKRARAADSERLAFVLESLSAQSSSPSSPASSASSAPTAFDYDGASFTDGVALVEALIAKGHNVVVVDQRLAANFGDLERKGKAVATPLWIATGRSVGDDVLALPVPHAQLVLQVRGPVVNADVTFYPALDLAGDGSGGTHFRGDVTADQPWCGGVVAHKYDRKQALDALRLMIALRRFVDERVAAKKLPLDGYFALGVCTLAPAVVEQALTGRTTLWPLTHDPALFDGDTDVDKLARALPHDGRGAPPPDDIRIKGSVPWPSLESVPFEHTRKLLVALHVF